MKSGLRIGALLLGAALVCAAAGCGGGGSSSGGTTTASTPTTAASPPPATTTVCKAGQVSTTRNPCSGGSHVSDQSEIETAWKKFFDGGTPVAQRVALLAGGSRFSSTIKSLSSNPLASKTSATVSKVTVTGPTTATVVFTVYLAGAPVLSNVKGTAVLQNGSWLVDAGSLCKLLALQGSVPAACPAGSNP
jgi:hypothetical protein